MVVRGMAVTSMDFRLMTIRVAACHPSLMLHGGAHRLALGVKLHMLGIFLADRDQSVVLIGLGVRVCFDLGDDALEMPPAPGKRQSLRRGLRGIACVERERRFKRQAGTPVLPMLHAEDAP